MSDDFYVILCITLPLVNCHYFFAKMINTTMGLLLDEKLGG